MNRVLYTSFLSGAGLAYIKAQTSTPLNIVLILCDDMGFSDLGCYGSEIQTPNVDSLAENGVRFSLSKNTGRSCPSRATLLTGHYQHKADMGWTAVVDEHRPGYRGRITKNILTIAEVMKANSYSTYTNDRWRVTVDEAFDAPNGSYPVQRGFDKHYGYLSGGGNYYKPTPVHSSLTRTTGFPDDYYHTTAIIDSAVSFVKQHPTDKSMFMYMAHYAPHLPLQAPAGHMGECINRYKVGHDALCRQRFDKLKKLKSIPDEVDCPVFQKELGGKRLFWETPTRKQQGQWIADMATYATVTEIVDNGIGELVEVIRQEGMLGNTVFIFLSDSGTTKESGYLGRLMADLNNTPCGSHKSQCLREGTSTSFVLSYGDVEKDKMRGQICRQLVYIIDILPTCIDSATVIYPSDFKDNLPGKSLLPSINGEKVKPKELYFGHQSPCAIVPDHWELMHGSQNESQELIDLRTDLFETKNPSTQYPKEVKKPEAKQNKWAERSNVFPLGDKL